MYCLRWWIPVFLLPFPAAPPAFMFLFLLSYALYTRPCFYCAAIIFGLVLCSCYFTTPYEAFPLTVPSSWANTYVGFGISRILQLLQEPPSPGPQNAPVPHAGCTTCLTTFGHSRRWQSLFTPMPRHPYCAHGAIYPPERAPSSMFIGIPGTALGFELDWSLFIRP